ncbi:MAG TPA: ABC transporter permease [Pyrinomonadaceae bacterium]|jgi:ABC-2 type transport system permease protein|nr:ABC transporter permease [Pyrinomonadaceae bacterium]
MRKFLAVVKREYVQRVRAKMFIVSTVLLPLVMSLFAIVPAIILNIDAGGPLRVAVVDQTGKMFAPLKAAFTNEEAEEAAQQPTPEPQAATPSRRGLPRMAARQFELTEVKTEGRSAEDVRAGLDQQLLARQIDGYVILPPDFISTGEAKFFNNNPGDMLSRGILHSTLTRAVREQRLAQAHVPPETTKDLFKQVDLDAVKVSAAGEERDSGASFVLVFGVGFIMYLAILMYGQVILGAVIEEKETRIAEILFSSIKPFTLMMGKLVGVSLVALTQLCIWATAFSVFAFYGVNLLLSRGVPATIPKIPFSHYIYFALFFLLGYFIYATIYALVGSMVTTAQEGGQLAMPIILILVVSFYLFLPVSRSPDSQFSFWVSMLPFSAPVAMLVRIVTQTPPFWQIALSLVIGFSTVLLIMWFASRVYRVGMLMYGKRASLPEAWRWVRQA